MSASPPLADERLGCRPPPGPILFVLVLLAGLGLAEWWLPPPPTAWQQGLLQNVGPGRVLARPGDDPSRHVELDRRPARTRVLWLGASTVLGVPYDPELSPPRWLELILAEQGADVEVVSLASPGATSHDVRHWLEGALALAPDAVVITSGHNEWLLPQRWLHDEPWRGSDLASWLAGALGLSREPGRERPTPEQPFDHGRVVAAFRHNLLAWESLCAEAGVPLVVTMPESNLADMPPVLDFAADDTGADAAYERGRRRLAVGDRAAALSALRRARDTDAWPHRATTAVQDVVKLEASQGLNVRKLFASASATGIPGAELFIDHCHPNPTGQRLLALAVARRLEDLGVVTLPAEAPRPPDLTSGQSALGLDNALLKRAQARTVKAWLRLALLRSEPGPLAASVRQLVDDGWLAAAEHDTRALLAVLEQDADALRAELAAASPTQRQSLQLLYDLHPWVVEALLRLELVLVDGELERLGR